MTNCLILKSLNLAVLPKMPTQEAPQNVLRFEHGSFGAAKRGLITYFEVHPQGLVAQGVDTQTVDEFLADVLETGKRDFGLRVSIPPTQVKVYVSSLVVQFETEINRLISKWDQLSRLLGVEMKRFYGIDAPSELRSISFKPDPERLTPRISGLLSDFTLERRSFAPYSLQRFYSIGPLPTEAHIKFLAALEEIAM